MKDLNRESIERRHASQPYRLEADNPYGSGRNVVAYGSLNDLEIIKSITDSNLNPVIVKNV